MWFINNAFHNDHPSLLLATIFPPSFLSLFLSLSLWYFFEEKRFFLWMTRGDRPDSSSIIDGSNRIDWHMREIDFLGRVTFFSLSLSFFFQEERKERWKKDEEKEENRKDLLKTCTDCVYREVQIVWQEALFFLSSFFFSSSFLSSCSSPSHLSISYV